MLSFGRSLGLIVCAQDTQCVVPKAASPVLTNLWRRPPIDMCATQNSICIISNHEESMEPKFV